MAHKQLNYVARRNREISARSGDGRKVETCCISPKGRNERSRGPGEIVIFVFQPLEKLVENGVNLGLVGSIPFRSHQ